MRNRRLTTWALLGLLAVGCSKSEPSVDNESGGLISFSTEANWTKGTEVNDISDVAALQVFSYATASSWSESVITPYFTDDISTPFTLNQANGTWTYNIGSRYWPADGRLLSFFAYYPENELTISTDDEERPLYSYNLNSLSRNNDDLLVNATYDLTKESNGGDVITLDMQHALTKITLQAKLIGEKNLDGLAYSDDYDDYVVNGIAFYDIYDNAILTIDEYGTVSWEIDTESSIELSSTQGQTLLGVEDEAAILNNESFTDVMADDKAIFVLPQSLSAVREAAGGVAPTALVRIRRTYYGYDEVGTGRAESPTEVIYESALATIPAPTVATISGGTGTGCWDVGQHVKYSFEFDITDLSLYDTPLAITSQVLDWTETTVTADIHPNLYIYTSLSTISVSALDESVENPIDQIYYGEFQVATNYDYNLRVPHHREELGGTITSSRGFLFCSDDFVGSDNNNVGEFTSGEKTYQMFVPTLLSVYGDEEREIEYATKDNISNYSDDAYIYEYPDGYNNARSETTIGTKADIVYGSNDYAYILNTNGLYRLLYLDPKTDDLTAFNYDNDYTTGYHEIKLTNFAADGSTVYFIVKISDYYSFYFSVDRSTREEEGLYVSTAISGDNSYGVNKEGDDAVYTLQLSVNPVHLLEKYEETQADGSDYYYGSFDDIIGVEMISNGGGMITSLFPVTLIDEGTIEISADELVEYYNLQDQF